jgi:ribosomal protein S17E
MAQGYATLIKEATLLLDKFNADKQCVEEFTEDASKAIEVTVPKWSSVYVWM